MSGLGEFSGLLFEKIKELTPVQTTWATVKSVDKTKRLMVATALLDGLDLHDVECGFDGVYKLPKVGAKCMVGMIENQSANYFLITAEDYTEINLTVGNSKLKIDNTGYKIDSQNENLKQVFNDMIDELNKIIVIQGTSINVEKMNLIKNRLNKILK